MLMYFGQLLIKNNIRGDRYEDPILKAVDMKQIKNLSKYVKKVPEEECFINGEDRLEFKNNTYLNNRCVGPRKYKIIYDLYNHEISIEPVRVRTNVTRMLEYKGQVYIYGGSTTYKKIPYQIVLTEQPNTPHERMIIRENMTEGDYEHYESANNYEIKILNTKEIVNSLLIRENGYMHRLKKSDKLGKFIRSNPIRNKIIDRFKFSGVMKTTTMLTKEMMKAPVVKVTPKPSINRTGSRNPFHKYHLHG